MESNYLQIIRNGNFIFHLSQSFVFGIWLVFIYTLLQIIKPNDFQNNIFLYLLLSTPFIIYILNIILNLRSLNPQQKLSDFTAFSSPPGWEYCLNTNIDKNKDILGEYNFECRNKNNEYLQQNSKDLINRFYYLNYILLFIIITLSAHTKYIKVKFSNIQNHIIGFSILFGVLASIISIFSRYLLRGLWVIQSFSLILSMNITCFILIVYSFLKKIR